MFHICHLQTIPPPGYDAWFANGGGSYTSPSFAVKNVEGLQDGLNHFEGTGVNYSTALIGNHSLRWIRKVATDGSGLPFLAYIAPKACHDPFVPAPWYQDEWKPTWPTGAPRPPSWNVTQGVLARHHPTISSRPPFGHQTAACIDADFKDRWRTLLSVDDIVRGVFDLLDELRLANNTYVIYTSDHGYSLGELNLNWDKRNVYDFDTRIHFLATGPGIPQGSTASFPASNADLAPTILAMAGLAAAPGMDGRSFLHRLLAPNAAGLPGSVSRHLHTHTHTTSSPWRTEHYIEYYYVGIGRNCGEPAIELTDNNFIALRTQDYLYVEFDDGADGNVAFAEPKHYELFDLRRDPWHLTNLYHSANQSLKTELHQRLRVWHTCKEDSCP